MDGDVAKKIEVPNGLIASALFGGLVIGAILCFGYEIFASPAEGEEINSIAGFLGDFIKRYGWIVAPFGAAWAFLVQSQRGVPEEHEARESYRASVLQCYLNASDIEELEIREECLLDAKAGRKRWLIGKLAWFAVFNLAAWPCVALLVDWTRRDPSLLADAFGVVWNFLVSVCSGAIEPLRLALGAYVQVFAWPPVENFGFHLCPNWMVLLSCISASLLLVRFCRRRNGVASKIVLTVLGALFLVALSPLLMALMGYLLIAIPLAGAASAVLWFFELFPLWARRSIDPLLSALVLRRLRAEWRTHAEAVRVAREAVGEKNSAAAIRDARNRAHKRLGEASQLLALREIGAVAPMALSGITLGYGVAEILRRTEGEGSNVQLAASAITVFLVWLALIAIYIRIRSSSRLK